MNTRYLFTKKETIEILEQVSWFSEEAGSGARAPGGSCSNYMKLIPLELLTWILLEDAPVITSSTAIKPCRLT